MATVGEIDTLLHAASACEASGEPYALATVVRVRGSSYRRPGARMLVPRAGEPVGVISGGCLESEAVQLARDALASGHVQLGTIDHSAEGDEVWGSGLGCRGVIDILVEPPALAARTVEALRAAREHGATAYLLTSLPDGARRALGERQARALGPDADGAVHAARPTLLNDSVLDPIAPPPHLVICGAAPDAEALVGAASRVGWRVTVADARRGAFDAPGIASAGRCDAEPRQAAEAIGVDRRTVAVFMSHDYLRDGEYLAGFLGRGAAYLGVLGPRERTERLLAELARSGVTPSDQDRSVLHAPAGLDIGADGPEEVATAVVAEILAVLHGHSGGHLADRPGPIHRAR